MSNISRTIRRNISQRQLQKGYAVIGKQLAILNRHELMLNALDKYIEQIELLLISKNVVTKEEVEACAERATQPIDTTKESLKEEPTNDQPTEIKPT